MDRDYLSTAGLVGAIEQIIFSLIGYILPVSAIFVALRVIYAHRSSFIFVGNFYDYATRLFF